jgi:hypothetical protein
MLTASISVIATLNLCFRDQFESNLQPQTSFNQQREETQSREAFTRSSQGKSERNYRTDQPNGTYPAPSARSGTCLGIQATASRLIGVTARRPSSPAAIVPNEVDADDLSERSELSPVC